MHPRAPLPCWLASLVVFAAAHPLVAQKVEDPDAPPELISMEGNAPKWKNLAELRRYAELGDPQAQFELGERLLNGDEVARDPAAALPLLEKAARNGIADAWFRLGKMYHDGIGVSRDYGRSLELYTEAARRGVPEAMHNVGAMLVSARGVKRDYVEGLAWLIVATKSGAVSMAEARTRERLATRPKQIEQAETRAQEIWNQLKHSPAEVRPNVSVAGTNSASSPRLEPPKTAEAPKKVEITPPPKLEAPKPQVSPSVSLPAPKIEPPKPEPKRGN
jgi:uncharacterized protein